MTLFLLFPKSKAFKVLYIIIYSQYISSTCTRRYSVQYILVEDVIDQQNI